MQYEQVNTALQETKDKKDKSEAAINKLNEEKSQIQKELARIQRELRERSLQVGIPTIGGSLITGSGAPSIFPSTVSSPDSGFLIYDNDNFARSVHPDLLKGVTVVDLDEPVAKGKKQTNSEKEASKAKDGSTDK